MIILNIKKVVILFMTITLNILANNTFQYTNNILLVNLKIFEIKIFLILQTTQLNKSMYYFSFFFVFLNDV